MSLLIAQICAAGAGAFWLRRSPLVITALSWVTIVLHFLGLLAVIQATGGLIASPFSFAALITFSVRRDRKLNHQLLGLVVPPFFLALLLGITAAKLPQTAAAIETVPVMFAIFILTSFISSRYDCRAKPG